MPPQQGDIARLARTKVELHALEQRVRCAQAKRMARLVASLATREVLSNAWQWPAVHARCPLTLPWLSWQCSQAISRWKSGFEVSEAKCEGHLRQVVAGCRRLFQTIQGSPNRVTLQTEVSERMPEPHELT